MDWIIDTSDSPGIVRITISGLASVDEALRLISEVLSEQAWRPGSKLLIDCRHVNIKELHFGEVDRSAAMLQERFAEFGCSKIALIVTSGVGFGVGQQFKILTEIKTEIAVELFLDDNGALAWLAIDL